MSKLITTTIDPDQEKNILDVLKILEKYNLSEEDTEAIRSLADTCYHDGYNEGMLEGLKDAE